MLSVLYAFLILTVLGGLLGIGLAVADKKLGIKKDPKLEEIESVMPGANCGGCGFAGCNAYAQAVFEGKAKPGLCSPGGQDLADKMAGILGLEAEKVEKKVAYVFCGSSSEEQTKKYEYKGIRDCNAASILFNGENECKNGCLHMGSCAAVCENNAISKDEKGRMSVDRELCIGCGKCVSVCPNGVIKLVPYEQEYFVACNNHDNGQTVRKICETGCIGCKICEVKFPESGFKVNESLASFSLLKGTEDTVFACETCPRKCIKRV